MEDACISSLTSLLIYQDFLLYFYSVVFNLYLHCNMNSNKIQAETKAMKILLIIS